MAEQQRENRNESEQEKTRRQNEGYDEAARGGKGVPPSNVGVPLNPGETDVRREDEFDRAAREAAAEVRRREHSAD